MKILVFGFVYLLLVNHKCVRRQLPLFSSTQDSGRGKIIWTITYEKAGDLAQTIVTDGPTVSYYSAQHRYCVASAEVNVESQLSKLNIRCHSERRFKLLPFELPIIGDLGGGTKSNRSNNYRCTLDGRLQNPAGKGKPSKKKVVRHIACRKRGNSGPPT